MIRRLPYVLATALTLLLLSCSSLTELDQSSLINTQSRLFQGVSLDDVFFAFSQYLKGENAYIRTADPSQGFMVALVQRSDRPDSLWNSLGVPQKIRRQENFLISVSLDKVQQKFVRTRISIQHVVDSLWGSQSGKEWKNPTTYTRIYKEVQILLASRSQGTKALDLGD